MKKIIGSIVIFLLLIPVTINATGGGLRGNTIKTCPDGNKYGLHSDGNSGTHWHRAKYENGQYYAKGNALKNDPCPNVSNDNTLKLVKVDGNEIKVSNTMTYTAASSKIKLEIVPNSSKAKVKNNYTSLKPGDNEITITVIAENTESRNYKLNVHLANNDTSISMIGIDGNPINVSDNMSYETKKRKIDLEIIPTDSNAKVEHNYKELNIGENEIEIIVTAENGDVKNYKLVINRIKSEETGKVTITRFALGANDNVEFKDNKYTAKKLKNESSLDYSYELSDKNGQLIIYVNDVEVDKLDNLKNNDIIKLQVLDEDGNENLYYITIIDANIIYTFLVYGLTGIVLLSPAIIGLIVYLVMKKKKKNKVLEVSK